MKGSDTKLKVIYKSAVQVQSGLTELKTKLRIEQEDHPYSYQASRRESMTRNSRHSKEQHSKLAALTDAEKRLGSETQGPEAVEAKVKESASKLEAGGKEHESTELSANGPERQIQ